MPTANPPGERLASVFNLASFPCRLRDQKNIARACFEGNVAYFLRNRCVQCFFALACLLSSFFSFFFFSFRSEALGLIFCTKLYSSCTIRSEDLNGISQGQVSLFHQKSSTNTCAFISSFFRYACKRNTSIFKGFFFLTHMCIFAISGSCHCNKLMHGQQDALLTR
jgi:hypothetical protein